MIYEGTEHFSFDGTMIQETVTDFWKWAYGDFINNIQRSVLAEYIVSLAIGCKSLPGEQHRQQWRPYDLTTTDGHRVEVKSAAYVQSWDTKHPDHVSYSIAPARTPDETGDYKDDSPLHRNSDIYVFALYKAMSAEQDPLDLDLWEFYVLPTAVLDREKPTQKTITLPSLCNLSPIMCKFDTLSESVMKALQ